MATPWGSTPCFIVVLSLSKKNRRTLSAARFDVPLSFAWTAPRRYARLRASETTIVASLESNEE